MIQSSVRYLAVITLFLVASSAAFAGPIVNIFLSVGPSSLSPTLAAYEVNAEQAIETGTTGSGVGTPGTPAFYIAASSPLPGAAFVATTFNSWLGQVPPPAPYSGEFGNAVFFGLSITSDVQFTMADVSLLGDVASDLTGTIFSAHTIGLNTTSGTRYDGSDPAHSGNDQTLINNLWTSGIFVDSTVSSLANLQAAIASFSGLNLSEQFRVVDVTGVTSNSQVLDFATAAAVPEPGALAFVGFALSGILCFRKRARSERR